MPAGDPGQEQFRNVVTEFRNMHIIAGLVPLMVFREEVVTNDEFMDRGGTDDPTKHHFTRHLVRCDRMRRRITDNPENIDLGDQIEAAIDVTGTIEEGAHPSGGDDIQSQSGGLIVLPWALDGTDENIPLSSKLRFRNGNGMLLLGAVDRAIVNWTRLNSRDRTHFITPEDSLRVYGAYQGILTLINSTMGRANRTDVANMLPTDEPRGPENSPNRS